MDEFQRVKKENVVKNNKKIVKTAFRKREKKSTLPERVRSIGLT